MSRFKVEAKSMKTKSPAIMSIRLDPDLIEPFRKMLRENDIKINALVNQMIRHCLKEKK